MDIWGVKSLESDAGLDFCCDFENYCEVHEEVNIHEVFQFLKKNKYLAEDPKDIDYMYDSTSIGLAEILIQYVDTGKFVYYTFDGDTDEEIERVVTSICFSKEDVNVLIELISDILDPKGEVHEIFELWEENDSFVEWKDHVNFLLKRLKELAK